MSSEHYIIKEEIPVKDHPTTNEDVESAKASLVSRF
jgi:hypothetical protein